MMFFLADAPDVTDGIFKYVCGFLLAANAAQYARDWAREWRYSKALAQKDADLAAAQKAHREDLVMMMPALTRVLDWMKK